MSWRPRILVLPISAAIITGLVIFRESQQEVQEPRTRPLQQLAPLFELRDQDNKFVKFQRYLGRTRIVVVFFDQSLGLERDPLLRPLLDHAVQLKSAGFQVVAISDATPYVNREAAKRLGIKIPFPVLTDIDVRYPIPLPTHRQWGCYHEELGHPTTALFLVDRKGYVGITATGRPLPESDPEAAIASLIQGRWPQ